MKEASAQKILIIDDDPVMTAIYRKHFETAKFTVQVANDATEGFVALQIFKPDVVLLDLNMPGRNGVQWLNSVRKNPGFKKLPVVMLTAQATGSPLLNAAKDAEVTGVLSKNEWGPDAVVAAVQWVSAKRPARVATRYFQ